MLESVITDGYWAIYRLRCRRRPEFTLETKSYFDRTTQTTATRPLRQAWEPPLQTFDCYPSHHARTWRLRSAYLTSRLLLSCRARIAMPLPRGYTARANERAHRPGGCRMHEALRYIDERVASAKVLLWPFPHISVSEIFPPEVYAAMRADLPDKQQFLTDLYFMVQMGRFE